MNRPPRAQDEDADRFRLVAALPVTGHRMELAGIPSAVLVGGTGAPIVLLHGAVQSALWWMRLLPHLVATHRAVAPDLPGHGATGLPPGPLRTERVLRWLGELIDRTCPDPPVLVGHGLGGAIALRFARHEGHRLHRLVLTSSLGLRRVRPSARRAVRLMHLLVGPSDAAWTRWLHAMVRNPEVLQADLGPHWRPFATYHLATLQAPKDRARLSRLLWTLGRPRIPPAELSRLRVPTHLIWGRHDAAVPTRLARDASARHGWPLHVLEDAGSVPSIERPDAFLGALDRTLATEHATTLRAAGPPGRNGDLQRRRTGTDPSVAAGTGRLRRRI